MSDIKLTAHEVYLRERIAQLEAEDIESAKEVDGYRARNAALAAELAAAKNLLTCTQDGVSDWLRGQIAAFLGTATAETGAEQHDPGCNSWGQMMYAGHYPCSCGLAARLAQKIKGDDK
jgi:hypothetical protein